jgi:nitrate/nitrite transporter NarK
MPFLAMNAGAILIVLGCIGYFVPDLLGSGDKYKVTALIPAAVGLVLELCGAISLSKPDLRKLLMHIAAAVGIIGTIGGFSPMIRGDFQFSKAAVISGACMSVVCLIFTLLCVRSFIAARKARQRAIANS